jgi:hypothetical protein
MIHCGVYERQSQAGSASPLSERILMVDQGLELLNQAKEILQRNTITVTVNGKLYQRIIPSREFYVHQWLWDSAGIAMGQVHLNEEAAFNELLSLIA